MFRERSNIFVEQIVNDTIRCLKEIKDNLRLSTDDQQHSNAVVSLERAMKALKYNPSRKQGGNPNRNSFTLPPLGLKVDIENEPFSITIPGIEESQKESTLEVVEESKEKEV